MCGCTTSPASSPRRLTIRATPVRPRAPRLPDHSGPGCCPRTRIHLASARVAVGKGGEHRLENGLLLRSDVHTMFDRGYLGVDPEFKLRVSRRVRDKFGNGDEFYERGGSIIALPERLVERPNSEFLTWHTDTVFLSA